MLFSIYFLLLVLILLLFYFIYERRKKSRIKEEFKRFYHKVHLSEREMRGAKRISLPEALEVTIAFTDPAGTPLRKGIVSNISLSGLAFKPRFPIRKLAPEQVITDVEIHTPVMEYRMARAEIIRFEQSISRRLLAIKIIEINDRDFDKHKNLLNYFEDFIQHEIR
jgi:hypothetical protein